MLTLHCYKRLLVINIFGSVVVRVLIVTKQQSLPNKVGSVRAAAEASLR
jgi:hypothetical protein